MKTGSIALLILLVATLGFLYYVSEQENELNFLITTRSHSKKKAILIDKNLNIKREWSIQGDKNKVLYARIYRDKLYALSNNNYLAIFDLKGKLLKKFQGRYHHDIDFVNQEYAYILSRGIKKAKVNKKLINIMDDQINLLNLESGKILKTYSVENSLNKYITKESANKLFKAKREKRVYLAEDTPGDLFHINSIFIIQQSLSPIYNKGDILISSRTQSKIFILDKNNMSVKWHCCNNKLEWQHHATITDEQEILLFDNGKTRDYSRIVKIDPITKKFTKVITVNRNQETLYSDRGSSVFMLRNKNYLVSYCELGLAFEINKSGEIQWELDKRELNKMINIKDPTLYRVEPVYLSNE